MGNSCVYCPKARNKKTGKKSPSKFFMDLLGYFSNDRKSAKENYVVGTNDEFRERYESELKFDENDEPTIDSYLDVSEKETNKEQRKKQLNKQLGSGVYDYDTALSKKKSFESQADDSVNEHYTPVMTPEDGHQVRVEMQENNGANRATTIETIKNKGLFDRIKAAINAMGADNTFIDARYSRYSTRDAERLLNGYLGIIQLSTTGDITADFAHEAGHFAVGALGKDHALIKRLEQSLSKEVIMKLMPEEAENIRAAEDSMREAMGTLVGKYILEEVDTKSGLSRLLGRIVNSAKKLFYKATSNQVEIMRLEAQETAEKIAYNFMTQTDAGSLDNAINTEETLFKRHDKQVADIFKEVYDQMDNLAIHIGAVNTRHQKEIEARMGAIAKGVATVKDPTESAAASLSESAVLQTLQFISELLAREAINKRIASVSLNVNNYGTSAAALRELDLICQYTSAVLDALETLLNENKVDYRGKKVYTVANNAMLPLYAAAVKNLRDLNISAREKANGKRKEFILQFMENAYGKEYIFRASRKVFERQKGRLRRFKLITKEAKAEYISDYLDELKEDEQFGSRFINMSNSKDIINQIMYIAVQEYKEAANQAVGKAWDDIRLIRKYAKEHNVDTRDLFEKTYNPATGHYSITGNYISSSNWGEWEQNLQQEREKIKEKFAEECRKKYNKDPKELPTMVRKFMYTAFARDEINKWHKKNSYYDAKAGRWVPFDGQIDDHGMKVNYHNHDYDNLFVEDVHFDTEEELQKKRHRKVVLEGLLKIKNEQDTLLTQADWSTKGEEFAVQINPYRMPQFRGRVTDEMSNIWEHAGNKHRIVGFLKGLRRRLTNWYTVHANDTDYGGNNPLDAKDEFLGDRADKFTINKVATYGIKKLENMDELSTDVFSSLLQYSSMANNYSVFYRLANILETGKTQLLQRKVKDSTEAGGPRTKAFTTYENFLKYQIYNDYEHVMLGTKDLGKFVNSISGLVSKLYLAGNVGGAIVNTGTGAIELFKEGFAGSEFSMTELIAAEGAYFACLPKNIWHSGSQYKEDKLALFTKSFNIGDRGAEAVRHYNTRLDNWVGNRLNQLPFLGNGNSMYVYSAGDHFMQSISYIAVAKKTQIHLTDGSTVSLWEALTPVEVEENGVKVRKLDFNPKFRYALNAKGDHMMTITDIDEDGDTYTKNVSFERDGKTLIMNKCREINNRMHGVYNKMDKSQFQSIWYGRLISVMKGYVFGKVASEFQTNRYSIALGRETEGKFDTLFKVGWELVSDLSNGQWKDSLSALYATVLPFDFMGSKKIYKRLGFNVEQYRNIRRMWLGLIIARLLAKLAGATLDWLLGETSEEKEERKMLEGMTKAEKEEYTKEKNARIDEELKELKKEHKKRLRMEGVPVYKLDDSAELEALYDLGLTDRANRLAYKLDVEDDIRADTGRLKLSEEDKEDVKYMMEDYDENIKKQSYNKYNVFQGIVGMFGYYAAIRMEREQEGYLPFIIPEMGKEFMSVLQVTPLAANLIFESYNLAKDLNSGEQVDRGSYYGYDRWQKDLISKTPYWKSLHILRDPVAAEEAWEYSRGRK